jgi:acetylornithine deacetylase
MKNIQAEKLLKSLIEIKSMSGEETQILLFLESLLKKEHFGLKRIPVKKDTFCLFATVGNPKIILQAHVDTVQPYIPFSENKDTIFGRGACDTMSSTPFRAHRL